MESIPRLSLAELNAAALDKFVYQPVSQSMISYLSAAAFNVITCDTHLMPPVTEPSTGLNKSLPPTPPRTPPEPRSVCAEDGGLPSLDEFIARLVVSSNVQVPTLMSTLVYLTRLKSRLQPMARGLRCTTHRIFLAALILSAKYLNDSSPKNKHWASYSHIDTDAYSFGFSRTEVNLMEKQLLFLLDWDLRITEEDLYREFDPFLAPLRERIQAKHLRHYERRLAAAAAAARYPSPPASRGNSRTRQATPEQHHIRGASVVSAGSVSPPGLSYSSSASSASSSYAPSSAASSRSHSRATTPLDEPTPLDETYMYVPDGSMYESPVEIMLEHHQLPKTRKDNGKLLLPYEISTEDLREMQDGTKAKRTRGTRGVWGRLLQVR